MKKVLIPTDFSEVSENAVKYAMGYFAGEIVDFYILHVAVPEPAVSGNKNLDSDDSCRIQEKFREFISLSKNTGHHFHLIKTEGLLLDAIREMVKEKEIDWIVMGTEGMAGNKEELRSNTYDVITKVKCPLMVIPSEAKFDVIRNVSFITDYNHIYRNKVIRVLSETLHFHKAPLKVLHLRSGNKKLTPAQVDNKGFLHYFFKDVNHSFHFLENHNSEAGIEDFVKTWDIDIITIPARNLNLIQRLMLRSSSEIDFQRRIPFFVLHE